MFVVVFRLANEGFDRGVENHFRAYEAWGAAAVHDTRSRQISTLDDGVLLSMDRQALAGIAMFLKHARTC